MNKFLLKLILVLVLFGGSSIAINAAAVNPADGQLPQSDVSHSTVSPAGNFKPIDMKYISQTFCSQQVPGGNRRAS